MLTGRPAAFAIAAAIAYGAIATTALAALGRRAQRPLGAANRLTLLRAVLTSLFAGAAAAPDPTPAVLWGLTGIGILALLLDGLDGRTARRLGTSSRFGAAFDQEIDALLILLLCLLLWRLGQAPAWVLAIGLLRYALLLAGSVLPALRRPLPQRRRRQVVCVVQVTALLACLPPLVPGAAARTVLAVALALLLLSFASDLVWLLRRRANRAG